MKNIIYIITLFIISSSLSFTQTVYIDNSTGKYGVKDKDGNQFIQADYDEIIKLDRLNNFRAVKDNTAYFYNQRGELLNKVYFEELGKFEYNSAKLKQKSRYGLINEFGDIRIPVIYDDMIWPMWGYAGVSKNGRWGISDLAGNIVARIEYDTIIAFPSSVSYAIVKQNGKYGVIDMVSGELTHNADLDDFYFTRFNYIKAIKNGYTGLLHYDGSIIANSEYDDIRIEEDAKFASKYIYVKSGNKWGVHNTKGEAVFAMEYDELGAIDKKGIIIAKKDGKDVILDVRKGTEK